MAADAAEETKLAEVEAAFRYAVARYWCRYDSDGPVWTLLGPLAVVLECLDDDGRPKAAHARDLPRYVKAARETARAFAEFGSREEGAECKKTVAETWMRMEEEMIGFRERWRHR